MGSFRTFLSEKVIRDSNTSVNSDVIFQKIIDRIDTGHVDCDDDRIEFHVGRLIKNSNIDLCMVIRPSDSDIIRLGKKKDSNEMCLVVDTTQPLPIRSEIDSFLAKNREVTQGVKSKIQEYLKTYFDADSPSEVKTKYEEDKEVNTSKSFENKYKEMVSDLNEKIKEFKEMTEMLRKEHQETSDEGKKATVKMAIRQLAKESFGENMDEFKKIARGILSKDASGKNTGFANNLSPENKKRLDSRLESYYDQKIKPLLKK